MARTATFTITLSDPPMSAGRVYYYTADKTAIAGKDYTRSNGWLDFAIGETSKTVSIPIAAVSDIALTFHLKLSSAQMLTVYRSSFGLATIQPDNSLVAKVNLAKTRKTAYSVSVTARDAAKATFDSSATALAKATTEYNRAKAAKDIADADLLNYQRIYNAAAANAATLAALAAIDPATYGAAALVAAQNAANALAAVGVAQANADDAADLLATKLAAKDAATTAYNSANAALTIATANMNAAKAAYDAAVADAEAGFVGSTKLRI